MNATNVVALILMMGKSMCFQRVTADYDGQKTTYP